MFIVRRTHDTSYPRDLKDKVNYKNVVFRLVGGHWQAELIDWGMAKVVGGQPKAPTTPEIWSWEC